MSALLGVREAASRLGVHENTLRRWAEKGYLKAVVNPTGVRRFRKEDIEAIHRRMYEGLAPLKVSDDVVRVRHVKPVD
jgi:excisionase family DNA binding protein